jgi:hypothetical protein
MFRRTAMACGITTKDESMPLVIPAEAGIQIS